LAKGVGHYGIFSGRKFREMIYPQILDFVHRQMQQDRPRLRLASSS
jgi:poly-beta-hydroxyalkanoate depolymerase